jgi:hypothetical protein
MSGKYSNNAAGGIKIYKVLPRLKIGIDNKQ